MRTLNQIYKEIESTADFSGIEITSPDTIGMFDNRPLHVASVWGDCVAIEMLINAGANIDAKGEHGFTPLFEAVAQGNFEAVKLLVTNGAKAIKNNDGQIPSEYATISENNEMANYLQKHAL